MNKKTGKAFLIYTAAVTLIAAAVRFFQYVSIMDYETGFFAGGTEAMGMLVYIIFAVGMAGLAGLLILGYKKKWTATTVSSDGMGSKATIFLGISFLLAAVLKVYHLFSENGGTFFKTVAMAAAALFFAAVGLMLMKSTVPPAITGFLCIFQTLIMFSQAIELFMGDLVIKNRSDNLILLLVYVSGTLMFASMARFYARLESKHSRAREIFLAGTAFIFAGTHVIAKLLALCFGGVAVSGMSGISPDAASIMIISGVYIGVISFTKQSKEIEYLIEKKEEKNKDE